MSPLRLLLEGPDLHTLLDQIRREYGAEARIVQAEKVRRGGVGGFFAHERFHIQVEVSQMKGTSVASPGRGGSPVKSVMDLVDRLNREEEALRMDVIDSPQPVGSSSVSSASAFTSAVQSAPPAWPANPPQALIRPSSAFSAPVSTQSASFADVMSRLEQSIDSPMLARASASSESNASVAAGAQQSAAPTRATSESPQAPKDRVRSPLSSGAQMAERATRMGVPPHVLAGIVDQTDVYRRLLAWVESRPTAPMIVSAPGQVIAVVGEATAAMRVASALALEVGVDQSAIHLAVPASSTGHDVNVGRLLSDVSDIAMRRERWQHSVASTIVVVEAALPPAAQGWLNAVVPALAPTFTWAVAQASTKVNDVVSWASVIGDVDALALVNVPATGDPAAALAGPLAVGLLDGQRATVTRWMAMLTNGAERR
jgi:hypothetical protein